MHSLTISMQNIGYFSHKYHILSKNSRIDSNQRFHLFNSKVIKGWLWQGLFEWYWFEKYEKKQYSYYQQIDGILALIHFHCDYLSFLLWFESLIWKVWKNQCKCNQISTVISDGYLFQWFICDFYMTNRHIPTVSEQFFGVQNIGNFINNYYLLSSNTSKMVLFYAFTNANGKWFYGFLPQIYTNDYRFEKCEKSSIHNINWS